MARGASRLAEVEQARLGWKTGTVMAQCRKISEAPARIGNQRAVPGNLGRTELKSCDAKYLANVGLGRFGEDDTHGLLTSRVGFTRIEKRFEFGFGFELRTMILKGLDACIPRSS